MSWIGVGVAAVGAIAGSRTASANRKRARAHDAFRKQAITYSPWTGMGDPGAANVGNTDTFTGMLGGAAQGYALGSGIGGAFGKMGGAANAANTASNAQGAMNVGMNTGQAMTLPAQNIGSGMMANNMGSAGAMGSSMGQAPLNNYWEQMGGKFGMMG